MAERPKINMDELHMKINQRGAIDKWTFYFLEKLRKQMARLKIRKSGELARSLQRQLILSGGDVQAVFVKFHMYGRFRDMGVGSGLKAYERGTNKANRSGARVGARVEYNKRTPARWYNKVKTAQIHKLREMLERDMGDAVVRNIKSDLENFTSYEIHL